MSALATLPFPERPARVEPWWFAPCILALVVLATRAMWLGDPAADYDEQLYSLIGLRWLDGAVPYVDLWDRKPAGLFALFAFAHAVGGPSPVAYQLLAMAFTLAGSLLIHALARPLTDRWGALLAGIAYPLMMPLYGSHAGQSEVFFLPLLLGALYLVLGDRELLTIGRAAAAMLFAGLALQVKYTALPVCLMLGGLALLRLWRQGTDPGVCARYAALFAGLGIAPTALASAIFVVLGAGDAFWWANFGSFFMREGAGRWRSDLPVALLPVLVPALLGLWAAIRLAPPRDPSLYASYAAFSLGLVGTVFLPGTVYLYYLAALVPAAILLALPLFAAPSPFARAAVLLLFGFYALFYVGLDQAGKSAERRESVARLTQAIAPLVDRDSECLWIFDGPSVLYSTTNSCIPTRFVYPDHLNNALETHALGVDQTAEVARILATRPAVIVTASDPLTRQNATALQRVRKALQSDYEPLASAMMGERTVRAWRLRQKPAG